MVVTSAIVAAEDLPVSLNSTTALCLPTARSITSGSSNAQIQITDTDAGLATDLVQVTLSVVKGTITIPTSGVNNGIGSGTIPAGESVVGNGTANVTITSTISRLTPPWLAPTDWSTRQLRITTTRGWTVSCSPFLHHRSRQAIA